MQITVFNGSPKGKESNTQRIAEAFLTGARNAGATTDTVFLTEKNIKHCMGCFSCWHKTPGTCIHQDDMTDLLRQYRESDIVCFATPVYLWNMTACLKNFLDRLIVLKCPTPIKEAERYDMENSSRKMPDTVIISNAGFPGENNFDTMKQVVKTAEPILELYRNCGMILKRDVAPVREYLEFVKTAGEYVARGQVLPAEVEAGLNMELYTDEEYMKMLNMA